MTIEARLAKWAWSDPRERLVKNGCCWRELGRGEEHPRLFEVFNKSLLGLRRGMKVDEGEMSRAELAWKDRVEECRILTISDFDGVVFSPWHEIKRKLGLVPRENYQSGVGSLLWLARMAQASDRMVLWTSRLPIGANLTEGILPFPFWDEGSQRAIRRLTGGEDKTEIIALKHGEKSKSLDEIVKEAGADIVYIIGSSKGDREAVAGLADRNPTLEDRVIFFDTGHLLI